MNHRILLGSGIIAAVGLRLLPFLWFVLISVKSQTDVEATPATWWPSGNLGFYRTALFDHHLFDYVLNSVVVAGSTTLLARKKLFVDRNLSVKGIGFFMESSSFYPDFILWVVDGSKQYIYFLDPKGILLGETHFNNPKVLWCKDDASLLEAKIQSDLDKDKKEIEVHISAFILSVTPFAKVQKVWSDGKVTKDEFTENQVLFIENNKEYLSSIFKNLTLTDGK